MLSIKSLICAAALSVATLPAYSEALSSADITLLQTRVDTFNTAFRTGDFAEVMQAMPPKMKSFIADSAGIGVEELVSAMIEQTKAAMATVTVEEFEMTVASAKSDVTPEGRPYSMIPTTTLMTVENVGKVEGTSSTLALKDEGKWYLIRIDDASQVQLLRSVYSDFQDIEFPTGTMKVIE